MTNEPDGHDTIEGALPDVEWRQQVREVLKDEHAREAMYSDEFLRHWYRSSKDHLAHSAFPDLVGLQELGEVMTSIEDDCRKPSWALWPNNESN